MVEAGDSCCSGILCRKGCLEGHLLESSNMWSIGCEVLEVKRSVSAYGEVREGGMHS